MTLLELLVALAVLGVMAGVVGLAWAPSEATSVDGRPDAIKTIIAARRRAVESGSMVRIVLSGPAGSDSVIALPNGSVFGADRFGFDPLSGRPARKPGSRLP